MSEQYDRELADSLNASMTADAVKGAEVSQSRSDNEPTTEGRAELALTPKECLAALAASRAETEKLRGALRELRGGTIYCGTHKQFEVTATAHVHWTQDEWDSLTADGHYAALREARRLLSESEAK